MRAAAVVLTGYMLLPVYGCETDCGEGLRYVSGLICIILLDMDKISWYLMGEQE